MYYGKIRNNDIANGDGVRVSLFVSGCKIHCKGCFQPETWFFEHGYPYSLQTVKQIIEMLAPEHIAGLSILGGEPMELENQPEIERLIYHVRKAYGNKKTIWLYSGYLLSDLIGKGKRASIYSAKILKNIDVLVEGPFDCTKKVLDEYRGSSNQRIMSKEMIASELPKFKDWRNDEAVC